MTRVPLLDVNAQNHPLEGELTGAFLRVLKKGHFIMGDEVAGFEARLAEQLGVPHAISVSSGTDALLLALMALGIGPGDEVIVPSFTFFATAGCVSRTGATPVFVDSCGACFNIDVADAARKITPRTRAILPVHLFGQCADMDGIMDLAQKHGLSVIEDAAQALGAEYRGRQAGTIGDFGTTSFFPSKNLGGLGDGGLLYTSDDALAEKARILRVHGAHIKYYHRYIGANFRMDALQCALLGVKLPHYAAYTAARRANAGAYTAALGALDGARVSEPGDCGRGVRDDARLVLPVALPHNTAIWNQYTLRVIGGGARDALRDFLQGRGIGCEIYYPVPLHRQECFADLAPSDCPNADILAGQVLSIPVYPELAAEQRGAVISAIGDWLSQTAGTKF